MRTQQDKIYLSSFEIRKKLDLPIFISSLLNVFEVCINDQNGHYNSFFAVTNQELFDITIELQKSFSKFSKSEKIYHYTFCVEFLRTVLENNLIELEQQFKKYVFQKKCMEVRGYQRPSMLSLWEKILVVVNFEERTLCLVNKTEERYNLNFYYMRESKDPAKFSLIFDSIVPNLDRSSIRVGFDSKNFNEVKIKLRRLMEQMEKQRLFNQLKKNYIKNINKPKTTQPTFEYLNNQVINNFRLFSQQPRERPDPSQPKTQIFKSSNKKITFNKGVYYLEQIFLTKKQYLMQSLRSSPSRWNNIIKQSMIIQKHENNKLQVIFYKFFYQDKTYESMIITEEKNTQDQGLIVFKSLEDIRIKNAFKFEYQIIRVFKITDDITRLQVETKIETGDPSNDDFNIQYLIEFSNLFQVSEPQSNQSIQQQHPYLKKLSYMSTQRRQNSVPENQLVEQTVYADALGTQSYDDFSDEIPYIYKNQQYNNNNNNNEFSSDFKSSKQSKQSQSTHTENVNNNNMIYIQIPSSNIFSPLNYKHTYFPLIKDQPKRLTSHFLDAEWKRSKTGTLLCTNKQVLSQQKKVAKHLLATFGKNILKVKGFLNISLPVSICCKKSHLQLIALNYAYAPLILEPYVNADPVERMKKMIIFNMTVGSTGIAGGSQKPFNPILGQTYQAVINGCHLYLQQISHHPAISAYFFDGRGYKCYGSIEPKIQITGLNSGRGYSDRENKIQFQDGSLVYLTYPKMFAKGFLFGEREFSFDSKNLIYDKKNLIFTELNYGPRKTSFFGNSDDPFDYVHGKIFKVTPSFDEYFKSQKNKGFPQKEHIVSEIGVIDGMWTSILKVNGSEIYNFRKELPCILEDYQAPLPSNSTFRLDLLRLIEGNLDAAQEEKERGEDLQRKDKNLREKYKEKRNKGK